MCLVTGVVDALQELNIKKLVVGTPYLDEINSAEFQFLTEKGFEVLDIQGLNLKTGVEFGRVTHQTFGKSLHYNWIKKRQMVFSYHVEEFDL